jgi:hypothetical protein
MFSNILDKQLSGNEYKDFIIDDNISATGMSFLHSISEPSTTYIKLTSILTMHDEGLDVVFCLYL